MYAGEFKKATTATGTSLNKIKGLRINSFFEYQQKKPLNHFTFTFICKFWKQFDTTSFPGLFPPSRKKPWERAGI